jgi:hypothetical protein
MAGLFNALLISGSQVVNCNSKFASMPSDNVIQIDFHDIQLSHSPVEPSVNSRAANTQSNEDYFASSCVRYCFFIKCTKPPLAVPRHRPIVVVFSLLHIKEIPKVRPANDIDAGGRRKDTQPRVPIRRQPKRCPQNGLLLFVDNLVHFKSAETPEAILWIFLHLFLPSIQSHFL